jgi:hypothetical protein
MGLMVCELFNHIRSNSLFKSQQLPTNHVSRSNHSRAKNQLNRILCIVSHGPSGFFDIMCPESLTFRVVLSMYLWLGESKN